MGLIYTAVSIWNLLYAKHFQGTKDIIVSKKEVFRLFVCILELEKNDQVTAKYLTNFNVRTKIVSILTLRKTSKGKGLDNILSFFSSLKFSF